MIGVKINRIGLECVENKFLKIPNIQRYEVVRRTDDGFIALVEMEDGYEFHINACFMNRVFPSTIMDLIKKQDKSQGVSILVAPYISERTAQICEDKGMGYFDYAGNCWFVGHSIFLSEKGNKNQQPKEHKAVSIFERSSVVSSFILRELFADVTKIWRLKYLAEKVDCSIGQVSKLMNFLVENAWAEKVYSGYRMIDSESLLLEWSKGYGKKKMTVCPCYSLDNISVIEDNLKQLKKDMGIDSYLTGLSGGARYAPVVRYNKVHVYIAPEDIQEAINYLDVKEVSSGANVLIFPLENDSYIRDYRVIGESVVVSPLQIYLDCMQIKGRGEEMAEAVLRKEIIK
ncbi:MAG: type IV toxin-antitoxin system AbiEi family antitoxin [Butyrivibrio sp.]|nr:type IV toxin-antitoxin system AbiEi family antitoxin [Butyrivibrio sp.]